MKVLHVLVSMAADAGGPAACVQGLTAALAGHGVQCEIAMTLGGRTKAAPLQTPGVPVHGFPLSPLARLWNGHSPALTRFLAENARRFEIIHVHELWHHPGFSACRAARSNCVPALLSIRGGLVARALANKPLRKRVYMRIAQRRVLNSLAAVHALTSAEAGEIRAQGISAPVFEAPNGVAAELLEGLAAVRTDELLRHHPQLRRKRVILFLGRIVAGKGPVLLARIFAKLANRFPDAALLVAGPQEDPHTKRDMLAVLDRAGLRHRVALAGLLTGERKLAALALASIFVLPSRAEGFSSAVVEALAAGKPAVVSEQCNFPQVAAEEAGFVLPLQEAAFADAIGALLSDDARRSEMGANAKQLVKERYTWQAIGKSFAEFYRRISLDKQGAASQ